MNLGAQIASSNASVTTLSSANTSLFKNVQDLSNRNADLSAQADFWNRAYHEDTRALKKAIAELRRRLSQEMIQLIDEVNAWQALARERRDVSPSDVEERFRAKMEEQRSDAGWVQKRDGWVAGQMGPDVMLPKR